jgi:AraC-like DNA-binding protein
VQSKPRTEERDLEQARANRDELAERIARLVAEDGSLEAAPGLFLTRSSSPSGPVYRVAEPSFCVIAQGSKEVLLGNERYRYDASQYLLVSAGLPLVGQTIAASKERPFLGLRLVLAPAVVTAVLIEAGLGDSRTVDAATAGYRVGYDDASHFNREYKRLFGEPPMRDVGRLRSAAAGATVGTVATR